MIFLMSRIAQKALFLSSIYSYDLPQSVDAKLAFWQDAVFNAARHRTGRKLVLEFVGCTGAAKTAEMPAELAALDIPIEVLRILASRIVRVNFQPLKGLEPALFVQRVHYLIDQALQAEKRGAKSAKNDTIIAFKDAPEIKVGLLELDLVDTDTFGYPGQVPFQLRHERGPWLSYTSDADRKKRLLLPEGNYYLKVDNKVRNVYTIRARPGTPVATAPAG
jgi:hypothetical protein